MTSRSSDYPSLFQHNLILNEDDIRSLGRILEYLYIDYNDEKAHEVVNKIFRTIHDMDSRVTKPNE